MDTFVIEMQRRWIALVDEMFRCDSKEFNVCFLYAMTFKIMCCKENRADIISNIKWFNVKQKNVAVSENSDVKC